ncbi:hypothetical protein BC938DRAFT_483686 [Jimgerdemannia flammicorona]|uniref:Ferric reductase NAD binding domain-containing protein n=1 Tax=Jimgerdemannia flammicorona TaxID=994334 RepID=A0A433QBH0_9FUNG|nr:hypothetical protein BC938DRAFT_483686 [Jimgerdemannia flammicorona]
MGLLKEMMRSVERGGVTKRVEFVWCISGQAQLAWFRKDLDTALLSTMDTNFSLTIRIFIREEGDDGPVDIGECFQSSGPLKSFDCDPRVQLVTGRARAEDVLRGFVGDCAAGEGVCVVGRWFWLL